MGRKEGGIVTDLSLARAASSSVWALASLDSAEEIWEVSAAWVGNVSREA